MFGPSCNSLPSVSVTDCHSPGSVLIERSCQGKRTATNSSAASPHAVIAAAAFQRDGGLHERGRIARIVREQFDDIGSAPAPGIELSCGRRRSPSISATVRYSAT